MTLTLPGIAELKVEQGPTLFALLLVTCSVRVTFVIKLAIRQ